MNVAVVRTPSLRILAAIIAAVVAFGAGASAFAIPASASADVVSNRAVLFQEEGGDTAAEEGAASADAEAEATPNIMAPETDEDRENTFIALGVASLAGIVLLGLGIGLFGYIGDR